MLSFSMKCCVKMLNRSSVNVSHPPHLPLPESFQANQAWCSIPGSYVLPVQKLDQVLRLGQMHLWLPSRSCMLPALLDLSNVHQHSPPLGLLILPGICYRIITWKLQGRPSASGLHPDQKGREKVTGTVICEQSTGKCSHKPWEALGEKILNTYSSLMIESRLNQCQREREGGGERPHGSPQDQGLKINVSRTDGVIVL